MSKGTEEKKGPSKKELKKLAKKAQKDAAKADAKQASGGGGGGAAANKTNGSAAAAAATAAPKKAAPTLPVYRLANVPTSLTAASNDACTIKACMGSILYSKELLPGGNTS